MIVCAGCGKSVDVGETGQGPCPGCAAPLRDEAAIKRWALVGPSAGTRSGAQVLGWGTCARCQALRPVGPTGKCAACGGEVSAAAPPTGRPPAGLSLGLKVLVLLVVVIVLGALILFTAR